MQKRERITERMIIEKSIRTGESIAFYEGNKIVGQMLYFNKPTNENCDMLYKSFLEVQKKHPEIKIDFAADL